MNPVNIPSMKLKVGELILRLWTVINSLRLTAENPQKLELCCFSGWSKGAHAEGWCDEEDVRGKVDINICHLMLYLLWFSKTDHL